MTALDRVLDVLKNDGQQSTEHGYGDYDRSSCWRCSGPPGEGASGVCDPCREVLLSEIPHDEIPAPIVGVRQWVFDVSATLNLSVQPWQHDFIRTVFCEQYVSQLMRDRPIWDIGNLNA